MGFSFVGRDLTSAKVVCVVQGALVEQAHFEYTRALMTGEFIVVMGDINDDYRDAHRLGADIDIHLRD
jgi:hypothetical protein